MDEHSREILNRPPPGEDADIPEVADDLNINTVVPEEEEVIKTIKSLKNGTTPGCRAVQGRPRAYSHFLAAIWKGEEVPADWTEGVIIRVPKKGALSD